MKEYDTKNKVQPPATIIELQIVALKLNRLLIKIATKTINTINQRFILIILRGNIDIFYRTYMENESNKRKL